MHDPSRRTRVAGHIDVWSASAASIDLCLFAHATDRTEYKRVPLQQVGHRWTSGDLCLPVGQLYALRAMGPNSGSAHFTPERLLLDPYARAIARQPSPLDPIGIVADDTFDWGDDAPPNTPWRDTIVYEAHVKGLTALHPGVPPDERGTFAGVASPPVIAHLRRLGVTAVELLPVHAHADEPALQARGLTNYWGYNTLSFFAPDPRFSRPSSRHDPLAVVSEFKHMVRELHRAGIEVILDVVYNHTAEGPLVGPTLSWRGLDPHHAYRWQSGDRTHYDDRSGCGNTLNLDDAGVRAMVLDSLYYWAEVMRVDGFRFDLASALDRSPGGSQSFFRSLQTDPRLADTKLIAEPWDATGDGYRLGAFPPGIAEWNGRYRDAARRFWRGDDGATAELATRLCGSEDLFARAGRSPHDSINYVTSHDGFTLADLVSYAHKHNETNGESNADGEQHNFSNNNGIEGPATDPAVLRARSVQQRSLLLTLMFSVGVPMISGGDELARTQFGNNNAYCQDNRTSWTTWPGDTALADFVRDLARWRRALPHFRRDRFMTPADVTWRRTDGGVLDESDWRSEAVRAFGFQIGAEDGSDVLVVMNGGDDQVRFAMPDGFRWSLVISSGAAALTGDGQIELPAKTAALLTSEQFDASSPSATTSSPR